MRRTFQHILAGTMAAWLAWSAPSAEAVPSLDYPGFDIPEEIVEVEIQIDGSKPTHSQQAETPVSKPAEAEVKSEPVESVAEESPTQPKTVSGRTMNEGPVSPVTEKPPVQPTAPTPAEPDVSKPAERSIGIQEVRLTPEEAAVYGVNLDMGTSSIPKVIFDEATGSYIPQTEIVTEDMPVPKPGVRAAKFFIRDIRLEAEELKLKKEDVDGILAECIGRENTLDELNETVGKLTLYSRQHGYPASAAYLPVQDSKDGVVTIKMIPGRYGEVRMHETGGLSEKLVRSFTNGLRHGEIIKSDELQTVLYSLSELSGTKAVGVLSAGKEFGTSDVTVRIEKGKTESTVLYAENYGSKSTGQYRYGIQHSRYDVGGTGARINAGGVVSNGGLYNFYANYEMVVGHGGTSLGLGYSRMNYNTGLEGIMNMLGGETEGTADTISLFGSRTVRHTVKDKLRFTYGYDYRKLKDSWNLQREVVPGAVLTMTNNHSADKDSHSVHVGVDGMMRQPKSILNYDLTLTAGSLSGHQRDDWTITYGGNTITGGPTESAPDADSSFTKANANLSYVHGLGHSTDIMFKLNGQLTGNHLDSSEQFYLGGANGVRAYPQGVGQADSGYLATAELRYHLPVKGLVLSTYLDTGHTYMHDDNDGGATLKGWGVGLAYNIPGDWFARLDYARRIGFDNRVTNNNAKDKGRFWFILGKIW